MSAVEGLQSLKIEHNRSEYIQIMKAKNIAKRSQVRAKLNCSYRMLPKKGPIQYPRDLEARYNNESFSGFEAQGYCSLMPFIKSDTTGEKA